MVLKAVCVLEGSVSGTVYFNQRDEKSPVIVSGEVSGLKKGKHGIHIHEFGDKTKGCDSIGIHLNPEKCFHGGPASDERHLGDLGNIEAQKDGALTRVCIRDSKISLVGANSIIGRTLVIHEKEDDLGEGGTEYSKTTGNTGACLSCGIIGIRKP